MITRTLQQPRDLRLRSVLEYAHKNWDLHRQPKTPWMIPIANLFRGRCAKLRMTMMMPTGAAITTMKIQRALDQAHIEILGSFDADISEEQKNKIFARVNELLIAQR